jgi:porin
MGQLFGKCDSLLYGVMASVAGALLARTALATPPALAPAAETRPVQSGTENAPSGNGPFAGLSRSSYLLGDMGGLRTAMSKYGLSLNISETSEVLGNASGGARKGVAYDGLTQMSLQWEPEHVFDWHGALFKVSGLQIHGRNLSSDNLDTLQTASGIEADRASRLWELWYDQKFLDEDRLDVKIGQQSLDQEFMVSSNALTFVNTMFGWPMLPSADMPGGGPAYPLSALGVRLEARPTDALTLLVGVFNGSPVSNNNGDPQKKNPSGVSFPLNGGALVIGEVQYAYPSLGTMVMADQAEPLSGVYRLGAWYDTESFADERYDESGLSLANPASNGAARGHHGNHAFYAVVDQMIWRSEDDADRNVNFFFRPMGTPLDDRNLITFSMNAGFTMHDPLPHRDDDTVGVGMGYAQVSDRARGLDRDTAAFTSTFFPARGGETFVEVTYQYQVTPWCQLQPDFQYVFNPGGGLPDPTSPGHRIGDEAVFGLRANINF